MSLLSLFGKKEQLISVDIGSAGVKLVELDLRASKPKLINIAMAPLAADVFSSNSIAKADKVSEQISSILEANSITPKRVVTAMPGPSVFTKKIAIQKMDVKELADYIQMEASGFIPHDIDAVRLDYHIVGELEDDQMEVLVVAVKNEIIDSYLECLSLSNLEAAVVDVDYFALQNIFELSYPDLFDSTVALINVGARYSSINICRGGISLFTGDIPVGGKQLTDSLAEELGLTPEDAERFKRKATVNSPEFENAQSILTRNLDYLASEYNRQISFFWGASGSEGSIDKIFLTGGASLTTGLTQEISTKTGLPCEVLDPFRAIECGDSFDADYLKEIAPFMSIALGMGIRQAGDKITTNAG